MARKRKLPQGLWKRGKVYYARFSSGDRLVRKKLSSDYTVACQLLNELKSRADRADFGILDLDYPWADLKASFLHWARQSVRNHREYASDLSQFEKFSHVQNVSEVTAERIDAYRNWRLDQGVTARTVNKQVGTINNMLNKGVDRFKVIAHNPIAVVSPLPHDQKSKQRRSLTLEEVESLFHHSPDYLRPVWRLFMVTGIRKEELVDLRFDDIDWDRQTMTVRASVAKSKRSREIPLDDAMMAVLIKLKEQAADREPMVGRSRIQVAQRANFTRDHVFVTQANTPLCNNLLDRFYSTCKRAGIEGAEKWGSVDIHSLRVTFTTLSLEHGASPKAVQSILGHSTLALTMGIYAKATERAKRDAISALPFASDSTPKHAIPMQRAATKTTTSFEKAAQVAAG